MQRRLQFQNQCKRQSVLASIICQAIKSIDSAARPHELELDTTMYKSINAQCPADFDNLSNFAYQQESFSNNILTQIISNDNIGLKS